MIRDQHRLPSICSVHMLEHSCNLPLCASPAKLLDEPQSPKDHKPAHSVCSTRSTDMPHEEEVLEPPPPPPPPPPRASRGSLRRDSKSAWQDPPPPKEEGGSRRNSKTAWQLPPKEEGRQRPRHRRLTVQLMRSASALFTGRRASCSSRVAPGSIHDAAVAAFPGAMKGSAVMIRLMAAVKPYGLKKANTIYGQSVCADEINSDPGHISTLLTQYYGRAFPLGGIGGAPYAGKTGFKAFSHHVPDGGHVLVVFGPHIGFSPNGEPGKFLRKGQAALSTSCGAVIAAYGQLTSGEDIGADPADLEQSWLRMQLKAHAHDVSRSEQPMVELVMRAYKEVERAMLAISNTDYGPGNLVLLGGIQINMPYPMPGYFMPLHFSIRSQTLAARNLMSHFS